jgi:hypothetical protein
MTEAILVVLKTCVATLICAIGLGSTPADREARATREASEVTRDLAPHEENRAVPAADAGSVRNLCPTSWTAEGIMKSVKGGRP